MKRNRVGKLAFAGKRVVRNAAVLGAYWSRLPASRRQRLNDAEGPLSRVVCFHRVPSREAFQQKLQLLKANFNIVALADLSQPEKLSGFQTNVAITFDDGFWNQLENALPLLLEAGLPSTFFLTTGCIGMADRQAAAFYRDRMGIPCERALSVEEVSTLANEPLVEIGLHTRTHADLGRIHDRQTLYQEIAVAKDELESMTGTQVRSFAYP